MSSPVVVRDGRTDLCDTYSSSREERVVAGAVLNEREGAEAVRGARRVGWGRAVFGSACLWAWGFLAYLSPVLIPAERPVGGVGIEVGFFVSQGAVVVAAVAIVLALRKRSVAVGRGVLLVCASLLALASALLPLTVAIDAPWPLVGCGAICGVAGTLLGCAWGARYSLESRDVSAVVMVSFLVAYGIYFAILLLYVATPFVVAAQVVVVFLPLASWGLWFWDASARSGLAPEVFPSSALSTDIAGSPGSSGKAPGEVTAGSRELHALPWRSLGVIAVAALVGNVMASVIMGTSYEGADSLYPGGIALCACVPKLPDQFLKGCHIRISQDRGNQFTLLTFRPCNADVLLELPFAILCVPGRPGAVSVTPCCVFIPTGSKEPGCYLCRFFPCNVVHLYLNPDGLFFHFLNLPCDFLIHGVILRFRFVCFPFRCTHIRSKRG